MSAAEKLTTLECSANRLTALDLSGHKELKVLTCSLNALTKLDLTGCTALESLDCSDNALAALDLSGCTALNATAQGDGKTENPILSPQYLPEQTGAVTDGGKCTVYFDVIVGKDNLGSITRVLDANYDKQTGEAEFAKTPDYFTYSYDTGRKGLPAMSVYFEMQNLTRGVTLDEKNFPDEAFRALLAETVDGNGDSLLSTLEMRRVSELNCSGLGIADLTGIEHFTQLVALNCENNELTALNVSKNTHLSEIYCGGNRLATLDLTGLPIKVNVSTSDLYEPVMMLSEQIGTAAHQVLEKTPPELAGDIFRNGVVLTGGGAQLHGLPEYLSQELKVDVTVSPDPVNCVALGTAMSLGLNDKLETGFLDATPRMGRR